eukprot:366536-Chlamydomonas_euryale.AAC.12
MAPQSQSYRERTHYRHACVERSKTEGIKQWAWRCHKGHDSHGRLRTMRTKRTFTSWCYWPLDHSAAARQKRLYHAARPHGWRVVNMRMHAEIGCATPIGTPCQASSAPKACMPHFSTVHPVRAPHCQSPTLSILSEPHTPLPLSTDAHSA